MKGNIISHEGKISLIVHTKSGKPKGLEILFQSPSSEYEVLGSLAQGPDDDLSLSFASRGKQLGKFIIRTSDKCFDVIYTRSGPASNVSLCFNKREHHKYSLVSLKAFVKNHKCIEAGISVDSKFPTHFNIVLECAKDDVCNLLKEIGDFEHIFHGHTTEEIIKELKKKFEKYIKEFIEPIRSTWLPKPADVRKCLHHLKDTIVKTLKSHFPDFYEHLQVLFKDFPDYAKTIVKRTIKKYIKCSGLCRYIVEFYKSHHLKQIRLSVSERFREVKDSILPFIFPFPGIIPGIFNTFSRAFCQILSRAFCQKLSQELKYALDSWKNKDAIARGYFEQLGRNFKINIKRWWNQLVRVVTFQPKEGKIMVQVRQPFGKTDIEKIKASFS
ncbi:vitellogenin [Caerostris extrusa]|uniref:Vitellogenin n=1 Tax=Caerostris extrusa TaxID=172846 RepID=A0AAV4W365_CAEEX|nr:vitellogenin [Caerostris extrusa]